MRLWVDVQLPSGSVVPAGTIEDIGGRGRGRAGTVSFSYAPNYLVAPNAYPLAPSLPLTPGTFSPSGSRSMLAGLADSQPDLWGRRLIDASRRRGAHRAGVVPSRASEVEILAAVPDATRQGALRFRLIDDVDAGHVAAVPRGRTPTLMELDLLIAAAKAFEDGEEISEETAELLAAGTSAGGARPKTNVLRGDGSIALAKLPRDEDFGDAMAWEATALRLSRDAGIRVPTFELIRVGDRSVLVLDRFDRTQEAASAGQRIGYLSADSLLDKSPGEQRTYVDLAEAVGRESSVPGDTGELFRRAAVSLLINNVDDHMRNHGMLRSKSGWQLSPAFDINPFYRHGAVESTPISDVDDPARRDIRNLVDATEAFRLTRDEGLRVIAEAERATSRWREVGTSYGLSPEGLDAMAHAFENTNRETARDLPMPAGRERQKNSEVER